MFKKTICAALRVRFILANNSALLTFVEQVNDNTLFVDSKDGYSFSVQLTNYNDYVLFSLTERKS